MRDIEESDWKIFKPLREVAPERYCEGVLDEVAGISSDAAESNHAQYLAISPEVAKSDNDTCQMYRRRVEMDAVDEDDEDQDDVEDEEDDDGDEEDDEEDEDEDDENDENDEDDEDDEDEDDQDDDDQEDDDDE